MSSTTLTTFPAKSRPVLWIILISFSMIVVDNSIVFTGLSKIQQELSFSDEGLSWISSIYALTFGGFLLLGARAGDMYGRRRVFSAGLLLFSLSSLVICLAPSPVFLVASRAVQGIGAAITAPSTLALLQIEFAPGELRQRAVAYYAAAGGVSASVGLVIGGMFAEWLSWRVGFFINVPIGVGLVWALKRYVEPIAGEAGRIDIAGALTSTGAIGALLFGIERSSTAGWADPVTIAALGVGILLLGLFVVIQARTSAPLMPLRLFASAERSGAYAARVLFLGANMGFYFFISQFMQGVLSMSAAVAGLAFLPSTIVNFFAAMIVPRFMRRFGNGPVLLVTIACGLAGMVMLFLVRPESNYWDGLAIPMILVGIGQGGSIAPLTSAGISRVAREDAGAASGVVNVAHQIGAALGIGILVAYASGAKHTLAGAQLLASRVSLAMEAAAVMLVLTLLIVLLTQLRIPQPVMEKELRS